jgi:hypothetical protein
MGPDPGRQPISVRQGCPPGAFLRGITGVGRVSQTLLNNHAQEECKEGKLYLATSDGRTTIESPVSWKRGDYIRVWDREDDSNSRASGLCFNLASGQIGRFYTNASFSLKMID